MSKYFVYAILALTARLDLSFASAASLCAPPPSDNRCIDGVGQFKGNPCMTLRAFQNLEDAYLREHAMDFAAMSRFVEDPKQLVGIHNSCCTGLMQLNYINLRKPEICGCTAQEFGAYSQQQQIDVYNRYLSTFANNFGIGQIKLLIVHSQTLGGHVVDGYTLVACAQMGTGNCDAAVRNECSSLAVGEGGDNHVNVCTMADKARADAQLRAEEFAVCTPNAN
jgi:hypothetical protein